MFNWRVMHDLRLTPHTQHPSVSVVISASNANIANRQAVSSAFLTTPAVKMQACSVCLETILTFNTSTNRPPASAAPLRLVLDTNVVIDAFLFRSELSQPINDALSSGRALYFANEATLAELERVLTYPALKLDISRQQEVFTRYCASAQRVAAAPPPPLPQCQDQDDQKFLELAAIAGAHWLISRDKLVLKLGKKRRDPAPFRL